MAKKISGSEIVIECLKEQGVDIVFGYPGGAILNVYDALYKHQEEITHVLTSHEQGAAHAADGYARATGKVGVCMATSGPGATNLVTGIATAYMDSVPMVAITANVGVNMLGKDSFQEIDIAGVVMPITKHSFIVKNVEDLAPTIRRAFKIAKSGRPGPVLVDITKDVTAAEAEYTYEEPAVIERKTDTIREEDINKVIEMIKVSRRPYIMAGGGVIISGASEELKEFAEKVDAPVCDTLMGKGAYDGTSERYTGMIGMHGTKVSNLGVSRSDLVIVVGARFSDRVIGNASKFAPNAKIIHIDIDAAEIDKNIPANASIVGDAKEVLTILNSKLPTQSNRSWMAEIKDLTEKNPVTYDMDHLNGPATIKKIYEITEGNAIITTDVGQHQMWAAQNYTYKEPRTFLSSGGLGTMGYGVGAAIGAKYGRPDKTVVNIAGDGCFRMNMNEIATAARYKVPIIQVVLNNHVLGMVRQWQNLFYGQRYSNTVLDDSVDFVAVSKALGANASKITSIEEFETEFKKALTADGPTVLDVMIDSDDKVWPMVAPGAAIDTCFTDKDLDN
ncbi:biosynthetic-type acetolactate synthase large subunit [Coprococcus eutactus]|jgi:acetolactate synthase-1/2/3 large subunit|uniref:Acetolactate synthase n=2 Tax=Coprococcus TaxID=33042 RepID=A0A8I0AGQ2_9FIRM|nr:MULTISPECIES: biosynthetic-type acetolactate synthase large subunit [Clostridia]RGH08974.1 biosynthetic-type acetolactate synthase large subunit [Clostridium sp. AF15-31]RHV82254.1 biosynthetic-type acetolactate synthase large subunit [Clostridium sp. OF10-22XD]SCH91448.1 Acetolactate synthase isozyme 2 large subunit [uncultured Coprococcus sp.]HAB87954.1 biosynthetic-type acetolactate synthase large subunit [Coprococcus sp.]MBC5662774.1 biosynthetic-type acetolactate synthase large subunit